MANVTVLDFPEITDPAGTDLLYAVRGSGLDRDRRMPLSRIAISALEITADQTIDLSIYSAALFVKISGSNAVTMTLNNAIATAGSHVFVLNTSTRMISIVGSSGINATVPPNRMVLGLSDGTSMVAVPPYDGTISGIKEEIFAASVFLSFQHELDGQIETISYGNGMYVAGTTNGSLWSSPDRKTWILRQAVGGSGRFVRASAFGNNLFVAAIDRGDVWTSPDGITWTEQVGVTPGSDGVDFHNGLFLLGGTASLFTSPDGLTWTERSSFTGSPRAFTYGNGIYVSGTSSGTPSNTIFTSPDGATWTQRDTLDSNVRSLLFGNGVFVAATFNGTIYASTDGITWTNRATLTGSPRSGQGLFVGGMFILIDQTTINVSADGIVWSTLYTINSGSFYSIESGDQGLVIGEGGTAPHKILTPGFPG